LAVSSHSISASLAGFGSGLWSLEIGVAAALQTSERIAMRALSAPADAFHLRALIERMVREGRPENEIAAAVEAADDGPRRATRATPRHWPNRLTPARRSR
jgi:hypothetical protein